jgi:hypothetical protein
MLQLNDYYPIDRDMVKKEWDEIMNIPNNQWNVREVDKDLAFINDSDYPHTFRTIRLNMLPALIIKILDSKKQ